MVWQWAWSAGAVLVQQVSALLRELSNTTASALNSTQPVLLEAWQRAADLWSTWQPSWQPLGLPLDEFQSVLLLVILSILVANLVLVYLAWTIYGQRINERFNSPDTADKIRNVTQRHNFPTEYLPKY